MIRNELEPVFNELLRLPIELPKMNDTLTITVADFDPSGYDATIAEATIGLNELVAKVPRSRRDRA